MIEGSRKKVEEFMDYQGDRAQFKKHLRNAVIGGAAILGLNSLNAPDIIDIVAYVYTAYQGFKAFRDYRHL